MFRSLFLLVVFCSTFTWPYFSFSCPNDNNDALMAIQVTLDTEIAVESVNNITGHGEKESENSISTPTLLEDFLHENHFGFIASYTGIRMFHYADNLKEGVSRMLILPPRR